MILQPANKVKIPAQISLETSNALLVDFNKQVSLAKKPLAFFFLSLSQIFAKMMFYNWWSGQNDFAIYFWHNTPEFTHNAR